MAKKRRIIGIGFSSKKCKHCNGTMSITIWNNTNIDKEEFKCNCKKARDDRETV